LFRGRTFVTGLFPATTTAATTTAAAAATAGLLVARLARFAPRFTIDRGPVSSVTGLASRLTGIQIDAPPVVVVTFGLPRRRPIAACGPGWGRRPIDRCIPIKTGCGSRWFATRRLAAGLTVTVAGRPPFAVVLTSQGSGTTLLTGALRGGPPRLEAEFVVAPVIAPIIAHQRSAARSSVVGPARSRLVPRRVVAIPASASPSTTASPTAPATTRFTAGAIPLGAIAILEDPAFGQIDVVTQIVVFTPTAALLGPGGRWGRLAAPR
jgi:hypothetical protein